MNFIIWFIIHQMFIKNAHLGFVPCMLLFGFFCCTVLVEIIFWVGVAIKNTKKINSFFDENTLS